ncbi:MAG TPA: hypothetical protein ENJ57_07430, partial [Rhizobiales bacterium]|nr:hypothetical protein [Hyphomicrobiales bacterium]
MIRTAFVAMAFAFGVMVSGNTASAALPGDSTSPAINSAGNASGSFKIAQRCISIDAIIRKVMRRGFYNIHR